MNESENIEKLLEEDEEYRNIYFEHRELDEVIKNLEEKERLTFDDEVEVRRLKKIKLSLKDRMELRINELKNSK
ncbi:MAG: YdcH family protein [Thermodesulfobacteriota bacterium]